MITIVYLALIITLMLKSKDEKYIFYKVATSLAYLAIAVIEGYDNLNLLIHFIPGLIAYWIGDALLSSKRNNSISEGMVAFLIGHGLFYLFYLNYQGVLLNDLLIPVISMVIITIILSLDKMNVRNYKVSIMIYTFGLSLIMQKSINIYMMYNNQMFLMMMIGFVLVYLSDLLLLFILFYDNKYHLFSYINLILYYVGLLFICGSIGGTLWI